MSEKSHVSMEQHICVVCGAQYDTGSILLDRRLRASMKSHTTTGWGLCPEHQRLFDEGFVALVECDPEKSGKRTSDDRLQADQAHRTGRLAHLKRDAFGRIFNVSIDADQAVVFVEPAVLEKLKSLAQYQH